MARMIPKAALISSTRGSKSARTRLSEEHYAPDG
jgi:hypothetical protein